MPGDNEPPRDSERDRETVLLKVARQVDETAAKMGLQLADREDLRQEAVLRQLEKYGDRLSMDCDGFAKGITSKKARHRILDFIRDEQRLEARQDAFETARAAAAAQRDAKEVASDVKALAELAGDVLNQMLPRRRIAYLRRRFDGASHKVIRAELGVSSKQLDTDLQRASQKLCKALADYLGAER